MNPFPSAWAAAGTNCNEKCFSCVSVLHWKANSVFQVVIRKSDICQVVKYSVCLQNSYFYTFFDDRAVEPITLLKHEDSYDVSLVPDSLRYLLTTPKQFVFPPSQTTEGSKYRITDLNNPNTSRLKYIPPKKKTTLTLCAKSPHPPWIDHRKCYCRSKKHWVQCTRVNSRRTLSLWASVKDSALGGFVALVWFDITQSFYQWLSSEILRGLKSHLFSFGSRFTLEIKAKRGLKTDGSVKQMGGCDLSADWQLTGSPFRPRWPW